MLPVNSKRPTIGFLSTWSVYEGTTIDHYTHVLLQGMCTAARELDCNLLIGCGISLPDSPRASRTAWAVSGPDMDFVPVGPWNSDGLIIIPDDLSDAQFNYVQDLRRSGYPVLMTTAEKPGPLVAVDNVGGIRQAFQHLFEHGHRQIAFLAGKSGRGGDSAERLAAYRAALREAGLVEDERLIAFGEHRREDGRIAMQRILESGVPFTALLASNDLSAIGAMEVLRARGRRIPEDVAVVGFDDILEGRSQIPPLTTIRHPTFALGYQAVSSVLAMIGGESSDDLHLRVPTQLVIRRSCGCRPEDLPAMSLDLACPGEIKTIREKVIHTMTEIAWVEVRHRPRWEVERLCGELTDGFLSSLQQSHPMPFKLALEELVQWLESHGEDPSAWQPAFSMLRRSLPVLQSIHSPIEADFAYRLIEEARLALSDLTQRQTVNVLLEHMERSDRLGLMTSQLLSAFEVGEIASVLGQHLPKLGIEHAVAALYSSGEDDPFSDSTLLFHIGLPAPGVRKRFPSRQFPPPGLYPPERSLQLAVLPLLVDEQTVGFAAFSATNLEPCAAIVHNLASALRTSRLYQDAIQGRKMAEEANRLKSRFLSMVSHELRTPLSLIVGLSEMALRSPADSPEVVRRDLEQIHAGAQHLARLIGDVLDLASKEAGQLRILCEPLDLTEIARLAARIGEPMAKEKGLEWIAQIPSQGPLVLGDRTRLRQVVLNLLNNAVKFTQQGKIMLKVEFENQQAVVSISDTGIGVPPEERESIFQEFQRSQRTSQAGYGGLGLGLAISRQLVEQHGGQIGVRSPGEFGCGSTFFFTLPLFFPEKGQELSLSSRPANSVALLTEGNTTIGPLYAYLSEHGFEVHVYRVDEDTTWLAKLTALPPAAIIMERSLAERESLVILEMLKRQSATEHVPILAYALDAEHNRGELLELNYLHKPLGLDQLLRELERYSGPEAGQRTILIVDDDPAMLEMHSRLVQQVHGKAITARNGREALKILDHIHPDLILLDLIMPGMDGFAVLDALKSKPSTRQIPVIVLTAHALSEADSERFHRGVAAILSKGMFSASEIVHHIESALTRQPALGLATQRLVRQAMACIHRRYAEPLTREEIAAEIGISPDYLTDCFRAEMGITPMTYLRRYRIRRACELLETTDLSIMQVALRVGFLESAHFTRTFQREMGVTPRAYRRGRRSDR